MPGDISEQPVARAVLRHLAETRGEDDAMGSMARTVLSGEANLRTAAASPWHAQGLASAFTAAQDERERMTPEQRTAYERQAERLRDSPPDIQHDGNEQ